MKKIILNSLLALLVFGGGATAFAISDDSVSSSTTGVACTQEAKQCPDGSFVGRMGPRCEFAKCPNATTTEARKIKSALEIKREALEKEKTQARLASSSVKRIEEREEERGELREKMEDRLASSSVKRDEKREEVKDRMEARVASTSAYRLERKFEKIARNYLKEVVRLEQILGRVVTRIEKVKSLGGNTTEAEKYLEEARTNLSEARKTYDVLKTIATNADNNATTTKEMIDSMKNSGKTVENHLRLAHKALQKTVGSLRGDSQFKNASSTRED
jgi:hypothetical protein